MQRAEHDFGVNMYAIGVGNYNLQELQIVTHNYSHRIFELKEFDELDDIVTRLGRTVFRGNELLFRFSYLQDASVCAEDFTIF